MIKKSVTMGDIAKELGVSTVSVSKAITGRERHNIGIFVSERFIGEDAYYSTQGRTDKGAGEINNGNKIHGGGETFQAGHTGIDLCVFGDGGISPPSLLR